MRMLVAMLAVTCFAAAPQGGLAVHSTNYGTGPKAIVFVHGWTCDESVWEAQVAALRGKQRVITVDLPGHGKSPAPPDGVITIDRFAGAIETVLRRERVERAVLAGHSMGALVVHRYAQIYPRRTAGLVFVDGVLLRPESVAGFAKWVERFNGPDTRDAREKAIRGMFSAATTPETQEHILRVMLSVAPDVAYKTLAAVTEPRLHEPTVSQLPALGVYQEQSPAGDGGDLKARYPKIDYQRLPGTGHFLMMERPAEFNRLLDAWLKKLAW